MRKSEDSSNYLLFAVLYKVLKSVVQSAAELSTRELLQLRLKVESDQICQDPVALRPLLSAQMVTTNIIDKGLTMRFPIPNDAIFSRCDQNCHDSAALRPLLRWRQLAKV